MTVEVRQERMDWLDTAARLGEIHTVRVAWGDRLGNLRGKRLPVELFLGSPDRRVSFCDGMIVVDVECNIYQSTPFSNFQTGYPDMYLRPRLETLAPVGWSEGEAFVLGSLESHGGTALRVAPRNVLGSVVARLARAGARLSVRLSLGGRLMHGPQQAALLLPDGRARGEEGPGVLRLAAEGLLASGVLVRSIETGSGGHFVLNLAPGEMEAGADGAVIAKAAIREVALGSGLRAVFMTRPPGAQLPSLLRIDAELECPKELDPARHRKALALLRSLLQPSINAFRSGPPGPARYAEADGVLHIQGLTASSEADPATVLAAIGAAVGAALDGDTSIGDAPPGDFVGAAHALERCEWAVDWLGSDLIENTVPLLLEEAACFQAAVTDWEVARYWEAG